MANNSNILKVLLKAISSGVSGGAASATSQVLPGDPMDEFKKLADAEKKKKQKELVQSNPTAAKLMAEEAQKKTVAERTKPKDDFSTLSKLLVAIGAGLTTAGGGDPSGILALAGKRMEKGEFNLKDILGQHQLAGTVAPGVTQEQQSQGLGITPRKTTKADIDLETERRLAEEGVGWLTKLLSGREGAVRREVLRGTGGFAKKTKEKLRRFNSEADARKAGFKSGQRVNIGGQSGVLS